jgi:phosphoribosylformimino-5-aminoimidazole carboxamide ribotide isomerase
MKDSMGLFTLFPAIDLRNGQVVRLRTGDPAQETIYFSDPARTAQIWLSQGAAWLHVVNLDAAFGEEDSANRSAVTSILKAAHSAGARVQFGGGLRSVEALRQALEQGVDRAVLGTAAALQPDLVKQALQIWGGERIAAGLDAQHGKVSVRGWAENTSIEAVSLAQDLAGLGLRTLIFTDIARDGTGEGGNLAATVALAQSSGLEVIASGGFTRLEELLAARKAGLRGVVLGRALYEKQLDLRACLAALEQGEDVDAG